MYIIPNSKHALIKFVRKVLNFPTSQIVYDTDVDKVKNLINDLIYEQKMSPKEIQKYFEVGYSDFGMFIKKSLGIKLLSHKDASINLARKQGRLLTDKKQSYKKECSFSFDPYRYKNIPGYDLLIELGMYHPVKNSKGVCRDHMLSVEYGFRNKISPLLVSYPANCQFITNLKNIKKR